MLFVCTGNRARSQMAEGLLRTLGDGRFQVFSAGTEPKGLADESIKVMREIGIDISGQRSKHVDELLDTDFDYVITVCDSARQVCPVFPGGGQRLHWDIADPSDTYARSGTLPNAFRAARDLLREHITAFVSQT